MATSKRRLNISLSEDVNQAIHFLAKRDKVPEATKASELLKIALEIQEDEYWNKIAEDRDTKDAKFISFEEFWKDALSN